MNILVCGGRDFTDKQKLFEVLWEWHREEDITIISGMNKRGADFFGWLFAHTYDIPCLEFPADWDTHGKAAGPIRNQLMIDDGKPDLVIAFPTKNSRGTWDMIRRAEKAGIKTIVVKEE
jgi:hypothetical protein